MIARKILIADDHSLILEGFSAILHETHDVEKIDTFTEGSMVCNALQTIHYDAYIIDLKLPDMSGFELIQHIRNAHPDAKILVCTMNEDVWTINRLMESKINGVVLKSSSLDYIGKAFEDISLGKKYYCPRFERLRKQYEKKILKLTPREKEVLSHIVKGLITREIAEKMTISENGVEGHRKNLLVKTGAINVAQLVAWAYENDMVERNNNLNRSSNDE